MNQPIQPEQLILQLSELGSRVKKLEDEVFKGDPPGLGERLTQLGHELQALKQTSSRQIITLDQKLDQVIRIVAELKEIVKQGGRTSTAGSQAARQESSSRQKR